MLDVYRRTFGDTYEVVVRTIRERLKLEPTGRPAKSTASVIEKLQRETIRLSQMQDIAGRRVIVRDVTVQDRVVSKLGKLFLKATIVDRRLRPSHGYRAVHVIVQVDDRPIEIQVRNRVQHLWAEISERASDAIPGLKYGRGPDWIQPLLTGLSNEVARFEHLEARYIKLRRRLGSKDADVRELRGDLRAIKKEIVSFFSRLPDKLRNIK